MVDVGEWLNRAAQAYARGSLILTVGFLLILPSAIRAMRARRGQRFRNQGELRRQTRLLLVVLTCTMVIMYVGSVALFLSRGGDLNLPSLLFLAGVFTFAWVILAIVLFIGQALSQHRVNKRH